ncbi:MAG: flagellar assembly protein FliW [Ruminococcus sp.]|nr:flagellar assembly protein FliW [Ruminococcus sp.]
MEINANYFGQVSYESNETIHIINGLIGFESYTEYLPIPFHEDNDSLISLQSLEDETLSFILMNPFGIYPDYAPSISRQDMDELKAKSAEDISYYVISVIRDSVAESTVNLKAPLIVNALNRQAKQVILEQSEYTFRHILGDMMKEED